MRLYQGNASQFSSMASRWFWASICDCNWAMIARCISMDLMASAHGIKPVELPASSSGAYSSKSSIWASVLPDAVNSLIRRKTSKSALVYDRGFPGVCGERCRANRTAQRRTVESLTSNNFAACVGFIISGFVSGNTR